MVDGPWAKRWIPSPNRLAEQESLLKSIRIQLDELRANQVSFLVYLNSDFSSV